MGGDPDEQELQKALLMSLQPAPEAKRSKPLDGSVVESQDTASQARRAERELRAAAAEQRMLALQKASATSTTSAQPMPHIAGHLMPLTVAEKLFSIVFGPNVSKEIITQWCHQGFRFSTDRETSLGLVQREGGPCGVLAPVQAMVLKYLLFEHSEGQDGPTHSTGNLAAIMQPRDSTDNLDCTLVFSDLQRTRALLSAMAEILWLVGGKQKAIVAVLNTVTLLPEGVVKDEEQDEVIAQKLEGMCLHSPVDLQKLLKIYTFTSMSSLLCQLCNMLPIFRSRVGALLFLFSALLSRGLEAIQLDRDDPGQPLVTAPFGHASQEIVNLLICGHAVPQVFDGNMDVGGGMTVKGIPSKVEVGFLTLLEALKYCTVGEFLKRPKWPIWVVGSESHYTVLFALQCSIQDDNELEDRERKIREAFDARDQSGGGGFIVANSVQQLLSDMSITMPSDMMDNLCSNEFVVWNELWQALHQIETSKGGLKSADAAVSGGGGGGGTKRFEVYHFNGIAKSMGNGTFEQQRRPRLARLIVTVPPKWTPEEYMPAAAAAASSPADKGADVGTSTDLNRDKATPKEVPAAAAQHAPIVDCIRTRWERATCNWAGDAPSIV